MGFFAGSGVGKSVLLSMLARNVDADVSVIGLIGERGREVQEFLQDDLGEEGLARSVVVVATSDEPALMRRQAAYLTLAIAEYFRDRGEQVLLMLNGVGSTTLMELYVVLRRCKQILDDKSVKLARTLVGEFLTVQEMGGFQMFLARMDDELLELWDAPCDTPALTQV
jgi:dihydroxyacetone kinase